MIDSLSVSAGTPGYSEVDVRSVFKSSTYDHNNSIQVAPTYLSGAVMADHAGVYILPTWNGTSTNNNGVIIKTVAGSGTIAKNIGINIENQTLGTYIRGLYIAGASMQNTILGSLSIGTDTSAPQAKLQVERSGTGAIEVARFSAPAGNPYLWMGDATIADNTGISLRWDRTTATGQLGNGFNNGLFFTDNLFGVKTGAVINSNLESVTTRTLGAAGIAAISARSGIVTLSGANPTTYATIFGNSFGQPTLVGTNAGQTVTKAATVFIAGAPVKSTNVTVPRVAALEIGAGAVSTATASWGLIVNAQTGASTTNGGLLVETGNISVGYATPSSTASISLGQGAGRKLLMYDVGDGSGFGLGIGSGLMNLYGLSSTSKISLGYYSGSTFVEKATYQGDNFGVGNTTPHSMLLTAGSFAAGYIAKTANYTAAGADYTIDCTANTFQVTLPTAVGISGRIYTIVNSGAGTITVGTTSSQTFTNVAATPTTLTMATIGTRVVQSNGANWILISSL